MVVDLFMLFIPLLIQIACSWEINNIAWYANFINNDNRDMQFSLFDDRQDGKYTSFGLVEISKIFLTKAIFFTEHC